MEQQELQLRHFLRLLARGKWLILFTTIVALAAAMAFAREQGTPAPTYEATATIMVGPGEVSAGLAAFSSPISFGDRSLNTQIELMKSRNVMEKALEKLQADSEDTPAPISAGQVVALRNAISLRPIKGTDLLEVRARALQPEVAEQRANAVVEAYIDYIKAERTRAIEDALLKVSEQLQNAGQPAELGPQAVALLPRFGAELASIAQAVEKSAQDLDELQERREPAPVESLLEVELLQMQGLATDLNAISQDLLLIQDERIRSDQQASSVAGSPLRIEALRLERATVDLEAISQELQRTQEAVQLELLRTQEAIRQEFLRTQEAVQLELQRTQEEIQGVQGLETISQELQRTQEAIQEAQGLEAISQELQRTQEVIQRELQRTQEAIQGVEDPEAISQELQRAQEALLQRLQRTQEAVQLELQRTQEATQEVQAQEASGATFLSLDADLATVLSSINVSKESLLNVSKGLETLGNDPVTPEEQDTVGQAISELSSTALAVDVSSRQLRGLLLGGIGPLVQAQLTATAGRLASVQGSIEGTSARLAAIVEAAGTTQPATEATGTGSSTSPFYEGLAAVQRRIEESADSLQGTLVDLQTLDKIPGVDGEAAAQAQRETADIALSLDIASRQLLGLLRGSSDPLLDGELGSLAERLTTTQLSLESSAARLSNMAESKDTTDGPGGLALAQIRLEVAAATLKTASEILDQSLAEPVNGRSQGIIAEVIDQTDTGAAVLGRITQDMGRFQRDENDPFIYGKLIVIEKHITSANTRATSVSSQLQQLQGTQGPGYEELVSLQQELELSRLSPQDTGITMVDSAVLPRVVGTSGSLIPNMPIPLGTVAGLLLGILIVVLKDQMDQTVRDQRRLRAQVGLPAIGVIPKGKARGNPHPPMVSTQDTSVFSEAMQLVGTTLEGSVSGGVRSLLLTSATAKEGKTMLAVNLAKVLAQHGHRVLLVDANLRKPDVAKVLGLPETEGLSTALAQQQDPTENVTQAGDFWVLPGGTPPNNPVELLSSLKMKAFFQQAQQDFDVVLVDSPPAVGFAETKVLAKQVNAAILVVRAGSTSMDAVKESKEDLEAAGVPLIGAVLNFAPSSECKHLRHDRYGRRKRAKEAKRQGGSESLASAR